MSGFWAVIGCAAGAAVNIAFYVAAGGHWYNLASAIFCGLMAIYCAVMDA